VCEEPEVLEVVAVGQAVVLLFAEAQEELIVMQPVVL
jgi:hypothetical protein